MRTFWLWIYIVGLAGFYLLVLFIIPLGARDLRRLLKELGRQGEQEQDSPIDAG